LTESPEKARYRDQWLKVHDGFRAVLNQDTGSELAAKSLYYMARTWEELARRSFLAEDARQAVDAFQRAANRFGASHSWADDCLYRKAEIRARALGETRGAAEDLTLLLERFPKGDQAPRARQLLAEIGRPRVRDGADRGQAGSGKAEEKGAQAPAAPARASSEPGTAAPVSAKQAKARPIKDPQAAYARAMNAFRAARAAKKPSAGSFERVAADCAAVAASVPRTELAAKALYIEGWALAELGALTGRETHLSAAAERLGQSASLFPPMARA